MPSQQTNTASQLLSFPEAATELGVDLEKLRRLVVEDRSIDVVWVDRGGNRKTINIEGLLEGGHWRVEEDGKLCVDTGKYEQRQRVGTSYVPLDVGELRIEREQLAQYVQRTPPVEVIDGSDAANAGPPSAPSIGEPVLPMGLDPETIASVFAGIYRSKLEWRETLKKPGRWLTAPGVVMRPGARGKGPDGRMRPTLRNPVELAKALIVEKRISPRRLNCTFRTSPDLSTWRPLWEAYREQSEGIAGTWESI